MIIENEKNYVAVDIATAIVLVLPRQKQSEHNEIKIFTEQHTRVTSRTIEMLSETIQVFSVADKLSGPIYYKLAKFFEHLDLIFFHCSIHFYYCQYTVLCL